MNDLEFGNQLLKKMKNTSYIVNEHDSLGQIIPENDFEKKMLPEVMKTMIKKLKILERQYPEVSIKDKEYRDTNTLKKCCHQFLIDKEGTVVDKTMTKYKQGIEYFYIFFGPNKLIKNITTEDVIDFRNFLKKVPLHWNKQDDLKGKDLKKLIQSKSKCNVNLLGQYKTQSMSNIDNVMTKCQSMFEFFELCNFVPKNVFRGIKKLSSNIDSTKRDYKPKETKKIFGQFKENNFMEGYNFFKFGLMTGMRRGEILKLKIEDIDLEKYIDIDRKSKSSYGKRIVLIHKDLKDTIIEQMKEKSEEDYLFFNDNEYTKRTERGREEEVGKVINNVVREVVSEETKKDLDIHSLRKNYIQTIFKSNLFSDLEVKSLVGHSTRNDVTDVHYLKGKRDYLSLKKRHEEVDFSEFFDVDYVMIDKKDTLNEEVDLC